MTKLGIISRFTELVSLLSESRDQEVFKMKSLSFTFDLERSTASANASATVLTDKHVKLFALSFQLKNILAN